MASETPLANTLDILVVDDEPSIRKMLAMWLETGGHRVLTATGVKEALGAANKQPFDLAFVDLRLGTQSGLDLIPELLKNSPWLKIVVVTAFAAIDTAVEAIKRGAMDYLPKPFDAAQVDLVVQKVLDVHKLENQIAALQGANDGAPAELSVDSKNPGMQRIFHRARQAARSDATILLRGENGTGKGVLARLVHQWSPRAGKPFGVVSCPSLSAELLESELFGHVKGAFTGAVKDNPGRIAACDGGTLFLDEIGDLPAQLQPKLLRFLQDREYEHVGDTVTRRGNVRVIAATNVDLEKAVAEGHFRQDLLYRLNVVQLVLPPLRERAEDIVDLAERVLAHVCALANRPVVHLTPDAKHLLQVHPWPGNVRELRNVLERAIIFAEGSQINAEQLGLDSAQKLVSPALGKLQSLEAMEEQHIRHVVSIAPSLDEAARILDIDIATLWRKRRKYGI